ncbi:MAG: hypothetical protein AAFR76_04385 [Planctomycetota bacterium]
MPEWIWHWSGYAVALLAFVGVLWALFWDRSRGRRRCRRCWYDMAGVPTEPGDLPAACPECGRAHAKPRHLTRTRRRWGRAAVLGLVMVVGGYGLWVVPRVQDEGWFGAVPTTVLIASAPLISNVGDVPFEVAVDVQRGRYSYMSYWGARWSNLPGWARAASVEFWYLTGWRRTDGSPSNGKASTVDQVLRSEIYFERLRRDRAATWAEWAFGVETIVITGESWQHVHWFPSGTTARGEVRYAWLEQNENPKTVPDDRFFVTLPGRDAVPKRALSDRPEQVALLVRLFDSQGEYCRLVVAYLPAEDASSRAFRPASVERLAIEP